MIISNTRIVISLRSIILELQHSMSTTLGV